MEVREFLRLLQRNWLLVLALIVAAGAVSSAYSFLKTPQYVATAKAYVTVAAATSSSDLTQGSAFTTTAIQTYIDVATTPYVLSKVIKQLGLPDTPTQLANRLTATVPVGETILDITVTDPSPKGAAVIANSVIQQLATAVGELAPASANRTASIRVTLLQSATPPPGPATPNIPLNIAIGVLVGVLLGVLAAAARDRLDIRITSPRDLKRVTERPLLGTIAHRRRAPRSPLIGTSERQYARVEEFKVLRSSVLRSNPTGHPAAFLLAASGTDEGTSTTAANLAIAIADVDRSVILVDANLRNPSLARYFEVDGDVGLTTVLSGKVQLANAVQKTTHNKVSILPAGESVDNPSELLRSPAMSAVLASLLKRYQVVLIDGAPLLANTDTLGLAHLADGVLLVCAVGRTDRLRLQRSLEDLDDAGAWVTGVVATMTPPSARTVRAAGRVSDVPSLRPPTTHSGPEPEPLVESRAASSQ